MQLDQFDVGSFLSHYWQKKPLLIRKAFKDWLNPLSPDELAGLACEEEVESRLVQTKEKTWELERGPISESRYEELKDAPWTLLVQSVDQFVPEVAELIGPFRFVPNWRIDDVMVSYATNGGGVGPHFDQYDVFLIQGLGQRRWRIGQHCDEDSPILPHDDLRLLASFDATEEWILEPGDMLYVPPGVAHDGVAAGHDCMTYSIGFRAPSRAELVAGWSQDVFEGLSEDDRYSDPELSVQDNPGEITAAAIARLHAMAIEKLLDRGAFARWFGQFTTAQKFPHLDWRPDKPMTIEEVRGYITEGREVHRNPASRYSFIKAEAGSVLLFVDGHSFECGEETGRLAEELGARSRLSIDPRLAASDEAVALLTRLVNDGSLIVEGFA